MGDVEGVSELTAVVEAARAWLAGRLPARVSADDLAAVRARLAAITARLDEPAASPTAQAWLDARIAALYGHAAALAVAGGDDINAARWLEIAEAHATGDERGVLAAARLAPARYRQLAEGRVWRDGGNPGRAARCWKALRGDDAIAAAARAERTAPVPLGPDEAGPVPWSINGLGTRLYGRRDVAADRTYTTTYWLALGPVPLLPLSAWRVVPEYGAPRIIARARLSRLARLARLAPVALVVAAVATAAIVSYVNDPERPARARFDGALALADVGAGEVALQALDRALHDDLALVDDDRAQRAGAAIVRLTAARVAAPVTADQLDAALRVVRRYQALPPRAQGPATRLALDRLERWAQEAGAPERLALLTAAQALASDSERARLAADARATRLALARDRADAPLDALAILIDDPADDAVRAADAIVASLGDAPSLLLDAGADLDRWLALSHATELVQRSKGLRALAEDGRRDALADGVTAAQLEQMAKRRAWDQAVVVELAQREAGAGKLAAAAARLDRLGPPGRMTRAARLVRAELTAAQGDLAAADAQLTALLGDRVRRFRAASIALDAAGAAARDRITGELERGQVPDEVRRRYEATTDATARTAVIQSYYDDQLVQDPAVAAARAQLSDLADVVRVSLVAGALELRRAQAMTGAARDAMLETAERTFLAVREAAGDQLEYRVALGEIYARLGKTAASEAELGAALHDATPAQRLQIAAIYRALGSTARARQVAREVYDTGPGPARYQAAYLLGLLAEPEDQEGWYRKSDPAEPQVQAQLLELEADRLERAGKLAECGARYLAAAKLRAVRRDVPSNDAALDYQRSFACSGDPQALRTAEDLLAQVYRANPQDAIVVQNYAYLRAQNALLRVISRRVDARALRLRTEDATTLLAGMASTAARAAIRAELAADPGLRGGLELFAQYAVLAPNSVAAYSVPMMYASLIGDQDAMAQILDRARHAKAIDRADTVRQRTRMGDGSQDARVLENVDAELARFEPAVANAKLDARTRGAGELLLAEALRQRGELRGDVATLRRARATAAAAVQHWPELDGQSVIVTTLIDEAAISVDAKAWIAVRRPRRSTAALAKLIHDRAPIVDRIRATPAWAELARYAPTLTAPPDLSDLRLAREARARAALDDQPARLERELAALLDPDDPLAQEDLADAR
jgi:hypothetical protein